MKEYTFPYGRGTKTFPLDEDRVLGEIRMPEAVPLTDIPGAVLDSIRHPIGAPPLVESVKPGDTVTFDTHRRLRAQGSAHFAAAARLARAAGGARSGCMHPS